MRDGGEFDVRAGGFRVAIDVRSGRYRRRLGYVSGVARLSQAVLRLGAYPERQAARARARRLAERLGLMFNSEFTTEDFP